jgi:hypothetical protein
MNPFHGGMTSVTLPEATAWQANLMTGLGSGVSI